MAYSITQIKIKYPATHEDVCQLWQDNLARVHRAA